MEARASCSLGGTLPTEPHPSLHLSATGSWKILSGKKVKTKFLNLRMFHTSPSRGTRCLENTRVSRGSSRDRVVPTGPHVKGPHRWSGSGLGARGRCNHSLGLSCPLSFPLSPIPSLSNALLSSPCAPDSRGSPGGRWSSQASLCRASGKAGDGGDCMRARRREVERPGGGVSESINHGPLRSCLTHFSNELSAKPLIN